MKRGLLAAQVMILAGTSLTFGELLFPIVVDEGTYPDYAMTYEEHDLLPEEGEEFSSLQVSPRLAAEYEPIGPNRAAHTLLGV